ncbi:hypothetical protein AVEN_93021-1 [Araneus ventricosus]|uniref:Uncharacterized protein n=1 Tax=Araneus ventricosus TaxID=182803 RepID=A0A4Y2SB80_ARAVE|nr:hypothetical protein AVEN_162568-1 [Araneus ventricosus]GBN84846.1 hypothetical protein AVEN_93021-1 [Araneus ventricosus]
MSSALEKGGSFFRLSLKPFCQVAEEELHKRQIGVSFQTCLQLSKKMKVTFVSLFSRTIRQSILRRTLQATDCLVFPDMSSALEKDESFFRLSLKPFCQVAEEELHKLQTGVLVHLDRRLEKKPLVFLRVPNVICWKF